MVRDHGRSAATRGAGLTVTYRWRGPLTDAELVGLDRVAALPGCESIGPELVDAVLDEASKFAPLDQLCLSPQCGFSSTVEGNTLSYEQEVAKLRLIVEVADEVWGS